MPLKPIGRQALYSMISSEAKGVVLRLVELSKSSNENVALGACKTLISKVLPDIKRVEPGWDNKGENEIVIRIVKGVPMPESNR